MKFGVSSYIWVSPFSNDTIDQLKHAKDLGFDIYEIGVEDPASFDPVFVKHEADRVGIQVNICGAFGTERDISSDNPDYRDNGMAYIRTLIDMASILGSPYVAGPMYAATGRARLASKEERERQWAYAAGNLRELAGYAASKGIRLALETLNRFETDFLNTVQQGIRLLDEIGCNNVGFLLDTFHMNIEESSIGDAIRHAGKLLGHFHTGECNRMVPGKGRTPWREIGDALREIEYDGTVVMEPFVRMGGQVGSDIKVWRDISKGADEEQLDEDARRAVEFQRYMLEWK